MLIVSWNVAALGPLVDRVHESYNPSATERIKNQNGCGASRSVALAHYMQRHGADIFCLQEHKIPQKELSSRSEPRGCSTVDGYESFWSCNVDQRKNMKGLNGVVTFARKGMVLSANAAPLGSKDLDEQGRCIVTDHGSFVLFNVYVPALGGQPMSFKMRFLHALRRRMQEQRKRKPVILVGDLNLTATALDIAWQNRVVYVQDILEQVASGAAANLAPWKRELTTAWPKIVAVMGTKVVVSTQTTNSRTGNKYDKFRLAVTVDGRKVYLGKHEASPGECLYHYEFAESYSMDDETGEEYLVEEANAVPLFVLSELMAKIAGIDWNETTQRLISRTEARVSRVKPHIQWYHNIIQEDNMVDTLRHFYPMAEARFTCWNQNTNRRYQNEGCRLDYVLVDACLLKYVQKGNVSKLRCGCSQQTHQSDEGAALCAVTANGGYQPAPYEGGGMAEASQAALDKQFGTPHTGIVYTPPTFSDHVGMSLLMDDSCCPRDLTLNERDDATRKAQPHKAQRTMADFLSKASAGRSSNWESSKKRNASSTKPANEPKGLKAFFASCERTNKRQRLATSKKPKVTPSTGAQQKEGKLKKESLLEHFLKES